MNTLRGIALRVEHLSVPTYLSAFYRAAYLPAFYGAAYLPVFYRAAYLPAFYRAAYLLIMDEAGNILCDYLVKLVTLLTV
jgi:hypothetical protein